MHCISKKIIFVRHFSFLFLILFGTLAVSAQPENVFSEEPEKFVNELRKMLSDTRRSESKEVADIFEENFEAGEFSEAQIIEIRNIANVMLNRKMRAHPHFHLYLQAINQTVTQGIVYDKFNNWHQTIAAILSSSKNRDFKSLENFLQFSITFFSDNAIYASQTKSWGVNIDDYQFDANNGDPVISFDQTDLMGYTTGDTLVVYNTSGKYFIFEERWKGDKGKITWQSVDLPEDEVYVTFGFYDLDVTKSDFVIDTVTMYYGSLWDEPIIGRLEHKLLINKSSTGSRYPQFSSFRNSFVIPDIVKNVDFEGGFEIRGREIIGSGAGEQPATLTFYNDEKELQAKARSASFVIDKTKRMATKQAEITIYFNEDSIFHPGLNMKYLINSRELSATTGEAGISRSRFFDSYHKVEMDIERLSWKMDEGKIYLTMLTAGAQNPAFFESVKLFEQRKFQEYQAVTSYNPIGIIKRLSEQQKSRELSAHAVAKAFNPNLSVDQIRRTLYMMVEDGFIYYDQHSEMITVKNKAFDYVWASAKMIDYDVIKIESLTDKTNAVIDLQNNAMTIEGVYSVPLSQSQFVVIFPKEKQMKLLKNRDMRFSGTVFGGRIDFFGKDYYFSYDRFDIELNDLDSMAINVPTGEKDQYGQPELMPVETVFENLNGRLYIDDPKNKSGREDFPEYPKFENRKPSYAYYDNNSKYRGVYERDSFFFEVDPFMLDSLDNFDIYTQQFPGTLYSANIFPKIRENLMVMGDRSMGFSTATPPEGYPLYGGLGEYHNQIELSNKGFKGNGTITFLSSTSNSNDILFFPDSLNAQLNDFVLAKRAVAGTAYPSVTNAESEMHWEPYADMMEIRMKERPFDMFEDYGTLAGKIQLTSKGLFGSGLFDWEDATLHSGDFAFGEFSLAADTSELKIKALDKTKVAFSLPNVKSKINFGEQQGNFKSNIDVPTDLPYNQYKTTMNEFDWDIEQRMITFNPPIEADFSTFISTHPQQGGLNFKAKGGTYDLNNYQLNASGVPFIAVADAHIHPGDGQVVIEADARMQELVNAEIFADSMNRQYLLYDANVKVLSRTDYRASGYYDYINRSNEAQVIHFQQIGVTGEVDSLVTFAEATILDTVNFELDPMINFQGTAELNAQNRFMNFNGVTKLNVIDREAIDTDWFKIDQQINPQEVVLNARNKVDQRGDSVFSGIHLQSDSTNFYATIMGKKVYNQDKSIFLADGVVTYLEEEDKFIVAPQERFEEESKVGNMLTFNNQTSAFYAEGQTDLGLYLEMVSLDGAGIIQKSQEDTTFQFNMMLGLDFFLTEEVKKMITHDFSMLTFDDPEIDYFNQEFQNAILQFMGNEKEYDKWFNKLNKSGAFAVPGDMDYMLFLTNINLVWDAYTGTYRSTGKIGLTSTNGTPIGKMLTGYVEFGTRRGGDFFNIYLETKNNDWYFFTYQNSNLQMLSSNVHFNDLVMDIKPKDRRLKGEKGEYITFAISNPAKKFNFVERMKYYQNN